MISGASTVSMSRSLWRNPDTENAHYCRRSVARAGCANFIRKAARQGHMLTASDEKSVCGSDDSFVCGHHPDPNDQQAAPLSLAGDTRKNPRKTNPFLPSGAGVLQRHTKFVIHFIQRDARRIRFVIAWKVSALAGRRRSHAERMSSQRDRAAGSGRCAGAHDALEICDVGPHDVEEITPIGTVCTRVKHHALDTHRPKPLHGLWQRGFFPQHQLCGKICLKTSQRLPLLLGWKMPGSHTILCTTT